MKKSLKLAVAASVLATPAMAANLENPLYMPTAGEFYSKTSGGLMLKVADSSDAHKLKGHDGEVEFPIWRIQEDLGIGITDRIAIRGAFAYTHDADIDRKGMNHGRLGLIWRAVETSDDIVFGKTWSKLTTSAFVEVLKTFGSDNNVIDVSGLSVPITGMGMVPVSMAGVPGEISVDLKSTTEINFGLNAFYQFNDTWSMGAGFKYNHHADNGVKSLSTDINYNPAVEALAKPAVDRLIAGLSDMNDGFDEYIVSLSVANQLNDYVQVALYGEYTFDTAHANSQNGTDVKAEVGVRLNLAF